MKQIVLLSFILLVFTSCSSYKTRPRRSTSSDGALEVVHGPQNCIALLKKISKAHGPFVLNDELEQAIVDMKAAGIHFSNEDLFDLQWGSSLSPIINDNYISYFLRLELQKQNVVTKNADSVVNFLNSLDSNQLIGIVNNIANNFKYGFFTSPDIINVEKFNHTAKLMNLSPDQLKHFQYELLRTVKQNEQVIDLAVLLRFKNRQQKMGQLVKQHSKALAPPARPPMLSVRDIRSYNKEQMDRLVLDYNSQSVFKVYIGEGSFYEDNDLSLYLRQELIHIEAVKPSFYEREIDELIYYPPVQSANKKFMPFMNKYYKKLSLGQLSYVLKEANIQLDNYNFLKSHLEHLKKMEEMTNEIKKLDAQYFMEKSWNHDLGQHIQKLKKERQDYFDQLDYLFE